MIGIIIPSTTFAYVLFFRLTESAGASNMLLVVFLIPVTAILLGVFALGEVIELTHIIRIAIDSRLFSRARSAVRSG